MGGLSDHFGEDASLDPKTADRIKKYHMDNAADSGWMSGKFMRGLSKSSAPLRITETPYWSLEQSEGKTQSDLPCLPQTGQSGRLRRRLMETARLCC